MVNESKSFAKILVLNCVRNTFLENLHQGIFPDSKEGDYSDVKVVSPYGGLGKAGNFFSFRFSP